MMASGGVVEKGVGFFGSAHIPLSFHCLWYDDGNRHEAAWRG